MRGLTVGALVLCGVGLIGCKQQESSATDTSCPECAPGCCLPDGSCQAGSLQQACGRGGKRCDSCSADSMCVNGSCMPVKACDSSCTGCCDGVRCVEIAQQDYRLCGSAAERCHHCGLNGRCEEGVCQAAAVPDAGADGCDEKVCADGCCQQGACLPVAEQSGAACGIGGASCLPCPAPGQCDDGVCVISGPCNNDSCAGCCTGGDCFLFGQQDESRCGVDGAACAPCDTNQTCQQGSCGAPCGPSSCAGCCEEGLCLATDDQSDAACGLGGQDCQPCNGTSCNGGSCGSCDAWSCGDGCCEGGECKDPPTKASCGIGGVACKKCDAGKVCEQGECVVYLQVKAASAQIKKRDGGWDENLPVAIPAPDTYLVCTAAGSGKTGQSSIVYDQYNPSFQDEVLFEDTADNLQAGLSCDAMDDDETAVPEYIGSCTFASVTVGTVTATSCTSYVGSITLKLDPK